MRTLNAVLSRYEVPMVVELGLIFCVIEVEDIGDPSSSGDIGYNSLKNPHSRTRGLYCVYPYYRGYRGCGCPLETWLYRLFCA